MVFEEEKTPTHSFERETGVGLELESSWREENALTNKRERMTLMRTAALH